MTGHATMVPATHSQGSPGASSLELPCQVPSAECFGFPRVDRKPWSLRGLGRGSYLQPAASLVLLGAFLGCTGFPPIELVHHLLPLGTLPRPPGLSGLLSPAPGSISLSFV